MKTYLTKAIVLVSIIVLSSCIDDDGTGNFTQCTDVDYYALMASNQLNPDNVVYVVKNTNSNITQSSYTNQIAIDYLPEVRNSNATWNKQTNRLFYLDESEREYAITYDLNTNTGDKHFIQGFTTGQLSAPIYLLNKLLVLDFDTVGNIELKSIDSAISTLSGSYATIPSTQFSNSTDSQETLAYSATDEICLAFFLVGNTIIEYNICTSSPLVFHAINLPGDYIDISYRQNGNLIAVRDYQSSIDIVELDILTSPGTASVIPKLAGINANTESIQLTYKECGDRLHVLTHFTFTGSPSSTTSKVIEVNLSNLNFVEQDFPGWIFGLVHDQQ